jgi:hypothetical protein
MIKRIIEEIKKIDGIESVFHVEGCVLAVYLKDDEVNDQGLSSHETNENLEQ